MATIEQHPRKNQWRVVAGDKVLGAWMDKGTAEELAKRWNGYEEMAEALETGLSLYTESDISHYDGQMWIDWEKKAGTALAAEK